jgi:hypothetical protein
MLRFYLILSNALRVGRGWLAREIANQGCSRL